MRHDQIDSEVNGIIKSADKSGDCRVDEKTKTVLQRLATKKKITLSAYVRNIVLKYVDDHPLKNPPIVRDEHVALVAELNPDAIVYTVPIAGAKIVVAEDAETGAWKGIAYHPERAGSTFAWNSENLNLEQWAKTSNIVKAFMFLSSRVDDDGFAHFSIPNTKFIISARWNQDVRRFTDGQVTNPRTREEQRWTRTGWFSSMDQGPFNYLPNIRRLMNLVCRAIPVSDGGLTADVPS